MHRDNLRWSQIDPRMVARNGFRARTKPIGEDSLKQAKRVCGHSSSKSQRSSMYASASGGTVRSVKGSLGSSAVV